ncbi:hypothetical protein F5B22DRAFT_631657 [Xylaria bambusicola]|uniref:uncharacterized protein n=1 Tax=Xylaria bambusicola TaxID=326684 RepID=UPI002008DBFA|nr:uncharacterized protein F5B22DRAFT_631657 [Xylaria bambusicola]KAI0502850.1 hypothetical protein F5B22DRAFT_631657 [Xylaria bambusicola]
MPTRQATREWDANRSYIFRRLRGVLTRKETHAHLQALSTYHEQQLVHWAIGKARLGFMPSIVKFMVNTHPVTRTNRVMEAVNGILRGA